MLADHGLVLGKVDAKSLVVGDEALLPLDARPELGESSFDLCAIPLSPFWSLWPTPATLRR